MLDDNEVESKTMNGCLVDDNDKERKRKRKREMKRLTG